MTDTWREIPARENYPGLTSLTRNGRTVTAMGAGPETRAVVEKKMREPLVTPDLT